MPKKLAAISALSLAALRGPILRSSLRFETPAAPENPAPAAPAPVTAPAQPAAPAPEAPAPAAVVTVPMAGLPAGTSPMAALRHKEAELTRLRTEASAHAGQLTALSGERDTARTQLAAANARIEALQAQVTTFEQGRAAHEAAVTQLATDRADFDRMVSNGVIEAQAAAGVPAAQLPASSSTPAPDADQLFDQWDKITDPKAKRAFYKKHEAILGEPRSKKK